MILVLSLSDFSLTTIDAASTAETSVTRIDASDLTLSFSPGSSPELVPELVSDSI
jgi:hypothetical protein